MSTDADSSLDDPPPSQTEGEAQIDASSEPDADASAADGSANEANDASAAENPEIGSPEFQSMTETESADAPADLNRIQKIQIDVSAELGRTTLPLHELMTLSAGSVLPLDQEVDSLVQIFAKGVPLASGEVVVVDGRFAIRILEVHANQS